MFARRTMDEVRIPYRTITKPGVTFRQETVRSIDPGRKRVVTNAGVYDADVLVVALGADLAPWGNPWPRGVRPRVLLARGRGPGA